MSPIATLPLAPPPAPPPASPSPYNGIQPATDLSGAETFVLNVPYRTQYDGSPFQNSDCGPAALGMVLQAYGLQVTNAQIRAAADRLQGTTSYDAGVALDYLQAIAQESGLRTEGLTDSTGRYRKWSMADLIREIRRGYPVITLVHYATLPDHSSSTSTSDHYVVVIGVNGDGFVVNDPAFTGDGGYRRQLRPDQLVSAWHDAGIPEQAVAFLPPVGKPSLALLAQPGATPQSVSPNRQSMTSQSETPGSPASLVGPWNPGVVPTVPASQAPSSGLAAQPGPPPAPGVASWAVKLSQWKHANDRETAEPTGPAYSANASGGAGSTTTVDDHSGRLPFLILGMIALIAAGALAILQFPGPDGRT